MVADWVIRRGDDNLLHLRWDEERVIVLREYDPADELVKRFDQQRGTELEVFDPLRKEFKEVSLDEDVFSADLWVSRFVQDAHIAGDARVGVDVKGVDWTEILGEPEPGVLY